MLSLLLVSGLTAYRAVLGHRRVFRFSLCYKYETI